ncbi:MAG: hypothetical protein HXO49_09450 [Prevotella sp.]|nr:hypothetical protein [Prevotella sp.]
MKKTMRQHSFASRLKSLALVFGIALTFASCANEDIAQNPNGTDNNKNFTIFSTGDPATRTSMESNGTFYWEAGDKIWVKDDDGTWQQSRNAPTEKTASFKFEVPGKFTKTSTYKVYYPGLNGNQNQVTIAANQSQAEPNTTAHFGTSGDCGMADAAWSNTKNGFAFTLDHKAAYLLFLPRTSNTILHDCYLTKVEVNSDNDITSTYTLDPTTGKLIGTGTGKQIIVSTGGSGTYANGFPLTNNATNAATNGAYMVIKPGTHTLKIRYWVKDVATNVEGTITKVLSSKIFEQNKYYNITANLNVREYDGYHYYMWDAKQNYWAGHEWDTANPWQPILNDATEGNNSPKFGENRFYNTVYNGTASNMPATQNSLFTALPNVNEMSWYVVKGDPHYDADEVWTTMGHLYKGGLWIKKKSKIAGFNSNTDYNGIDWRAASVQYHSSSTGSYASEYANTTKGQPTNINDYFYIPSLGKYDGTYLLYGSRNVQLKEIGQVGYYWTSTGTYWDGAPSGYYLMIQSTRIFLSHNLRTNGYITQPTWFE